MVLKLTTAVENPAEPAPAPPSPTQQDEAQAANGALTITITLEGIFKDWLQTRARDHQEEIGEHAAGLLRAYWAHHDMWRHRQSNALTVRRDQ